MIREAIAKWGNRAADIIRKDPFATLIFKGVGFPTADRLWIELGHPPDSIRRQEVAAWYAVWSNRGGHTWVNTDTIRVALREQIASDKLNIDGAIKEACDKERLTTRMNGCGKLWVADFYRARSEQIVANYFGEVRGGFLWPDLSDDIMLDENQHAELDKAMATRAGVLSGYPGTGKTRCLARLAKACVELHGRENVAICAPTGKAAVRAKEMMHQAGVDAGATTIHTLLGVDPISGGFQHNASNHLPKKIVLADECSMVDSDLMADLVSALSPDAHLLLVGDASQLPPVGHGFPLRDLIENHHSAGVLTEVYRNEGQIKHSAKTLHLTGKLETCKKLDIPGGLNLITQSAHTPDAAAKKVVDVITATAGRKNYDPKWHVQVLCATNKGSPVSRRELNQRLQQVLNANGDTYPGNPFKIGDKVVCRKNGWYENCDTCDTYNPDRPALNERPEKVYVANGDMGEVVDINGPQTATVELQNPYRVVRAILGKSEDSSGVQSDKERWELAYACTVHTYQGSQVPIVLLVIDGSSRGQMVIDRHWVYTGITRAETACMVIGQRGTIIESCRRQRAANRKTFLGEMLREYQEETV